VNGVDVLTRGDVLDTALQAREYLVTCGVPAALAAKDPRLWGRRAVDHSRLGWLDLPGTSHDLLPQLELLVDEVRSAGLDHIVLVALGADGLAAQALAGDGALTVLDGADTEALELALAKPDRTLVVLSSKRGVSLEGDAYRRVFTQAFRDHGLSESEISDRFLAITDHGSPLDSFARQCGYRLGLTDPYLPGHFGALSAYGIVPAMLAGADAAAMLDEAAALLPALAAGEDNPGLLLGAILGGCANQGKDKLVLREPGGASPLSEWIAQLVATGTGRRGQGVLPFDAAGLPPGGAEDAHSVMLNPRGTSIGDADTSLWGPTGAQVLLWEYATAVAGWLMGLNPFEPAGSAAQEGEDEAAAVLRAVRADELPMGRATFTDEEIEVRTDIPGVRDMSGLIAGLTTSVPAGGYLSVVSYLSADLSGRYLAPALARRSGRPVAYGAGPGYMHSTASYHKLGPGNGAFLVISGEPRQDRAIPGRPYTLGSLRLARALADVHGLRRRGLPVTWLHLREPVAGAARLAQVIRGAG